MPRHSNRRSWLYRIRPSAMHQPFERIGNGKLVGDFSAGGASPNQLRWNPLPLPLPSQPSDFLQGLTTMAGNADIAVHLYAANQSMGRRAFHNADAQRLIVPQEGRLRVVTEFGQIDAEPQEIVLIPRGERNP